MREDPEMTLARDRWLRVIGGMSRWRFQWWSCDDLQVSTYRRAHRPAEHRLVGGVAAGLAEHLSVPVMYVRLAFIVAIWFNGAGVIAYLLLWRFLPLRGTELSPGLETATRSGLRESRMPLNNLGSREILQTTAVSAIGIGIVFLLQLTGRGPSWRFLAPLLLVLVGVALIWRQFDDANWSNWMRRTTGWTSAVRIGAGATMLLVGGLYFLTQERGWTGIMDIASAAGIAIVGVGLIGGPWIIKLSSDLSVERRERIRSQERADVAAHLHDSVLQTLALLQKNSADPAAVSTLARRQERELRDWLYGNETQNGDSLVAALRTAAGDVESDFHTAVDVVAVGDERLNSDTESFARAAREAMVNAAKHAHTDRIDVYLEVGADSIEIFIRDRGIGFDPEAIAADRMGVRGSIVGRVERHGGSAKIKSVAQGGTEIHLTMPLHHRNLNHDQEITAT